MNTTPEVEEIVEEFEKTWSDFIGDIEFSDAFKHLADDPNVPFILPEMSNWLSTTLTTLTTKHQEELEKAVEAERKKIRRDLRRVYFDIIITCCDECKNGSKFSCGGCGGTRRPSNASCGEPLDKYIQNLTPTKTDKQITMNNSELIDKWTKFAFEMIAKRSSMGMFQPVPKARCEEKVFMAISFITDLGGDVSAIMQRFQVVLEKEA